MPQVSSWALLLDFSSQEGCASRFCMDMWKLFLMAILAASILTMTHSSLLDFKFMIRRITGKSALISYNAYGCHCGLGGRGQPLDRTDWCCHAHDCCYTELTNQSCHPFFDDYQYSIINKDVMCWNTTNSTCAKQACDCDRTAVLCFRKEASSYNKGYRYYFNFFCKGSTPSC